MINPEARRARARLAAHRRWRPGDDLDALTEECYRAIEVSRSDDGVDDLVALVSSLTDEQRAIFRRLANSVAACG